MNRNEPMFATNFWPDVAINLCLSQIWFSKINYYNYLKASSMLVAKKLPLGWGSTLNLVLKHGFLEGPLHLDDFPIKASIYRCFPIFPMVSYGFPLFVEHFPGHIGWPGLPPWWGVHPHLVSGCRGCWIGITTFAGRAPMGKHQGKCVDPLISIK